MIKSTWFRILAPILLIIIWLGVSAIGGPTFGKISSVTTNNQSAFLPASAESTQVQELQSKYQSGQSIPAIVIIESNNEISRDKLATFATLNEKMTQVKGVEAPVIGPIPSKDGKALEFIVSISNDVKPAEAVKELRTITQSGLPEGTQAYVTGPAGLSADLVAAFGGIDGILLAVALGAVFIILLIVYRSVLLPILVLLNSVFALCASILVIYTLAKSGVIELNGQSQGILSILVIGAATDYSLLLVARYKEALAITQKKWDALWLGLKGSFEPIAASAATVILALLCLLFSDLNSNKSLGPIAATGIFFSFVATLTFLPSLLVIFGKVAFWPSKIALQKKKVTKIKTGQEDLTGIWKRVGSFIARNDRKVWIMTTLALIICSFGLLQLKATGVPQTDLILTKSNAAEGQKAIARHFDSGSGSPVLVSTTEVTRDQTIKTLQDNKNIDSIMAYSEVGPSSDLTKAKVIDGHILLSATLKVDPYSSEAEAVITSLRSDFANTEVRIGGTTATALDTSTTAESDLFKIVPIVLGAIFIVLVILLRSLVAPLLLIITVALSFAATLGISALVFNHIFQFPGADAAVPLFGFVFLVALGVDYNIFLISRTREEALKYNARAAIVHSLGKTGGVITSAGIVLAATFAALGVIPILFLAQIAFIVSLGVLLDTFIVRSLLVPALFHDLGKKAWWPSRKIK